VIEMVKQKRRQSIGFSYTAGETPSHQAGDDIDDSKRGGGGGEEEDEERSSNGTDMFRCSCNAGKIEEELLLLRKATTHALRQIWADIEELRQGTSMKMAEIETLEDIITDVETEQVYITGQIQRKSKEIERKKKPKRRPSLAHATRNFSRSLSFSTLRSVGSVGNNDEGNLMTRSCRSLSMGFKKNDEGNLLTRSCRSLSMGLGVSSVDRTSHSISLDSTFHSVSLDRTSHSVSQDRTSNSVSLDAPRTEPSISLHRNKMDKAKLPELAMMSDGDDTSSESFNARDKRKSSEENYAVETEINELKMKIRQREETIQSLESTIFENMEIVQNLQKRMISWNQVSLDD